MIKVKHMEKTITSIFILASINAFAQTETYNKEDLAKELQPLKSSIQTLQKENRSLKFEIINLNTKLSTANKSIDSLRNKIEENSVAISQTANQLGIQITTTEQTTNKRIDEVGQLLSRNSLYGIIGVLSAILLSVLLYWLLSKRQKTDKTVVLEQLQKTKTSIEESLVKELGKQTSLLESELQLLAQQKTASPVSANTEPDHSLALRVAGEITIIERNLSLMDSNVKGYKQLKKSVEKLKDNLLANGYEIIELHGKPYHPGLPVTIINSYPDENLEKDQEIISKILVPAVRYNDKIIQSAQVEVSVGV
jgi:cell division septum initiation protein DivIVA